MVEVNKGEGFCSISFVGGVSKWFHLIMCRVFLVNLMKIILVNINIWIMLVGKILFCLAIEFP